MLGPIHTSARFGFSRRYDFHFVEITYKAVNRAILVQIDFRVDARTIEQENTDSNLNYLTFLHLHIFPLRSASCAFSLCILIRDSLRQRNVPSHSLCSRYNHFRLDYTSAAIITDSINPQVSFRPPFGIFHRAVTMCHQQSTIIHKPRFDSEPLINQTNHRKKAFYHQFCSNKCRMADGETVKFKPVKRKNLRVRKRSSDEEAEDEATNEEIL